MIVNYIKLNIIKIIIVILIIIIVSSLAICYIKKLQEKRAFSYTITYETIEKIKNNEINAQTLDGLGPFSQIVVLLNDNTIWDKLALSDSFKKKYKRPKDIISDIEKCESIDVGFSRMNNEENTLSVFGQKRPNIIDIITEKRTTTEYVFKYITDENNLLDDMILIKEIDFDSMTSEIYSERINSNY